MKRYFVFIVIICILALSGCATGGSRYSSDRAETQKTLEVATHLKFEDVPAPNGFKIVPNDSFIFDNDTTRLGIIKYAGSADASTVVKFYREQMPLYGWKFVNLIEFNMRIMNFDREDQTCVLIVEPHSLNTTITISVAPKAGRSSTRKSEK